MKLLFLQNYQFHLCLNTGLSCLQRLPLEHKILQYNPVFCRKVYHWGRIQFANLRWIGGLGGGFRAYAPFLLGHVRFSILYRFIHKEYLVDVDECQAFCRPSQLPPQSFTLADCEAVGRRLEAGGWRGNTKNPGSARFA